MVRLGYADVERIRPLLMQWIARLTELRITTLISDNAPLALVAAKILRLEVIEAGGGFCLPPATTPMPPFPLQHAPAILSFETALTSAWTQVCRSFGAVHERKVLCAWFQGHSRQVCSIPALDPYGPREGVEYLGPLPTQNSALATPEEVRWGQSSGEVVGYLKLQSPHLRPLLKALQGSKLTCLITVPGIGGVHRIEGVTVTDQWLDLASLIPRAKLFITNGGIHGVGMAVQNQVPVLAVPMHAEQAMTAALLIKAGLGTALTSSTVTKLDKFFATLRPGHAD